MLKVRDLPDQTIPQSFQATHYCLGDMLRLLGLDKFETGEALFWANYKAGKTPTAVWLNQPMFDGRLFLATRQAAAVWEKAEVDRWIADGMPWQPGVDEREQRVLAALLASVSEAMPTNPITDEEMN
jgi:hypothetical protein